MNDINGLREASEWALRELEAGKPKPTRNAFRALLLAWGLDSRQYHAWAREYAPDIELRWSRARGLWAEAMHGFVLNNQHRMSNYAMARALGVSKNRVANHIATMRNKPAVRRRPNKTRALSEAQADILDAFAEAILGMARKRIPDPRAAYERAVLRFKASGLTSNRASGLIELHRPAVYALYHQLQKKRATNLLRVGLSDGPAAMGEAGDLNANSCKVILYRVRKGYHWFGIALRDGELVDLKRWEAERQAGPK